MTGKAKEHEVAVVPAVQERQHDQLDAPPLDIDDLPVYEAVAKFHGNPFRFLMALMKDPTISQNEALRQAGNLAQSTFYGWKKQFPTFEETFRRVISNRDSLRQDYARAVFLEATPAVAEAMVERAKGTGRDAQRATERILETSGVLGTSQEEESVAVDLVAGRLLMRRRKQVK